MAHALYSSQPSVNGYALRGECRQSFDPVFRVKKLGVALLFDLKTVVDRHIHALRYRYLGQSVGK